MKIKIIKNREELEKQDSFEILNLLWGTKEIAKTYGYLGFVPDEGFYLKMICEEKNPLRIYTKFGDPVYQDSAMEAFFMFGGHKENKAAVPYFNFEMNANGAFLTEFGEGKRDRKKISEEIGKLFRCEAEIEEKQWSVSLHIPISVIEQFYGEADIKEGYQFACNFYKISETKKIEHYASCFPIDSETPNFHMPEFFGNVIID